MAFINDHVEPLNLAEQRPVADDVLKCRQQDLKLAAANVHLHVAPHVGRALVHDLADCRRPLVKLQRPVGQGGQGYDDEVGPILVLALNEIGDQADGLNGFAKTHFIRENAVEVIIVERYHPLQTLNLVILEGAADQDGRLRDALLDAVRDLVIIDLAVLVTHVTAKEGTLRIDLLLVDDGLGKRVEKAIGLLEQLSQAGILGLVNEFHVGFFVIFTQRTHTFARDALCLLLLLFLDMLMVLKNGAAELVLPGQELSTPRHEIAAVVANGLKVLEVLFLLSVLEIDALLLLGSFEHVCLAERRFFQFAVGHFVAQGGCLGHGPDEFLTELLLLVGEPQLFELDELAERRLGGGDISGDLLLEGLGGLLEGAETVPYGGLDLLVARREARLWVDADRSDAGQEEVVLARRVRVRRDGLLEQLVGRGVGIVFPGLLDRRRRLLLWLLLL